MRLLPQKVKDMSSEGITSEKTQVVSIIMLLATVVSVKRVLAHSTFPPQPQSFYFLEMKHI